MSENPTVLFVCVKNAGKSQMAAGLMRQLAGDHVDVASAGKRPGGSLNELPVATLREIGVDISEERPKPVTDELVAAADLVVALGREAHIEPEPGTRVENWVTDETSEWGSKESNVCGSSGSTPLRGDRDLATRLGVVEPYGA